MREPVRDRGRLEHIIDAIDSILQNTKTMDFSEISSICGDNLLFSEKISMKLSVISFILLPHYI